MNLASRVRPAWTDGPSMHAFWVATEETPEWIATRIATLFSALGSLCGVTTWTTFKGDRWDGSLDNLTEIVRRFVVRDRPTAADPDGEAIPEEGYSPTVSGSGSGITVKVRVRAGSIALARQLPVHTLLIDLQETVPGSLTAVLGDAACEAVAQWHPAMFVLSDRPVRRAARRGGWKIDIGYRTWVSSEVGTVNRATDGLTVTALVGGTLISAPDEWPAERVVSAMVETLAANGLDEVPH